MIIPEYTQGDWYAVVAEGLVVMLAPTASPAIVRETWTNLRNGGGLEGQVSLMSRLRTDDVPGIAVVDLAGGRVRAIVRGAVEVEVIARGVPTVLGGQSSASLLEQVVDDAELVSVRALTMSTPWSRDQSALHLPVLAAVVGAQSVRIQLRSAATSDQIDEMTIERPRVPMPAATETRAGRGQAPDGVAGASHKRVGATVPARLRLSTGLVVSLDRAVLLGRAPQVSRVANSELPRLVTVASPEQDISRTHAEVRIDGDDVLVTDLHSTNGVLMTPPGEGSRRLHPGEPTVLRPSTVVDLGEGVTFTVERG